MKKIFNAIPWQVPVNLLLAYICYEACRIAFLFENWSFYRDDITQTSFWTITQGGLFFDTSAICFTNALYILLALQPFGRSSRMFRELTKWNFVLPNIVAIVMNLMDAVYFSYTQQRVTANAFSEFQNEQNLGRIFAIELVSHWYLVALAVLLAVLLIKGYRERHGGLQLKRWQYGMVNLCCLLVAIPLVIVGMRGAFFRKATRPVTMNDAFRYATTPIETYIVLNTPFSIIKTWNHSTIAIPVYFESQAELDSLYTPVHYPRQDTVKRKKNVVILIVESYAQEFIGSRNAHLDSGTYKGYTPFADSLLAKSLTWRDTFCNGWTSIDAMPAVLASIPKVRNSFVLSPFAVNRINSIATELGKWGYNTAFFHGAENQSMGFQSFARAAGFKNYFGREEFYADTRFGGEAEFDGTWGIWDEPFLQFFCAKMNDMHQPFLTALFTLSSHHPFAVPDKYKDTFKDEGLHKLHKCIRYTDYSLKRFFETASRQPWYENTIFVLCADHASSKVTHDEYKTHLGHFRIPILFFDPSGELTAGCRDGIAQQIDIMPTILSYLGYDRPYIAFGIDLLNTNPEDTWTVEWQQMPMYVKGNFLLYLNDSKPTALFDYHHDSLLKKNLVGQRSEQGDMELQLKAFLQSYMQRMKTNDVTINE